MLFRSLVRDWLSDDPINQLKTNNNNNKRNVRKFRSASCFSFLRKTRSLAWKEKGKKVKSFSLEKDIWSSDPGDVDVLMMIKWNCCCFTSWMSCSLSLFSLFFFFLLLLFFRYCSCAEFPSLGYCAEDGIYEEREWNDPWDSFDLLPLLYILFLSFLFFPDSDSVFGSERNWPHNIGNRGVKRNINKICSALFYFGLIIFLQSNKY